jgi:broad specificity phosphatase PhoE
MDIHTRTFIHQGLIGACMALLQGMALEHKWTIVNVSIVALVTNPSHYQISITCIQQTS